uniref:Uncharacterized protein n=1 Tax=Oryzias melastigma TaxID=30732 RepID=A0A3B3CC58_ORYME
MSVLKEITRRKNYAFATLCSLFHSCCTENKEQGLLYSCIYDSLVHGLTLPRGISVKKKENTFSSGLVFWKSHPDISLLTLAPTSLLFALSLLTCDSAMSALSSASSSSCCSFRSLARFALACRSVYPGLQLLDLLFATFHGDLLGFIQAVLQVLDGLLHILLHALQVRAGVLLLLQLLRHHGGSFVPAAGLRLQGALQSVHHSLMVALGLIHLLVFLRHLPLNVCLHLVKLQLSS